MIKFCVKFVFGVSLILCLSGCGVGPQTHYSNYIEESIIDIDYNPILLMNVRTKNPINSKHFLIVKMLEFEKDGERLAYQCIPNENIRQIRDNPEVISNLIFLSLKPGHYKLNIIKGMTWVDTSQGASSGSGYFQLPLFIEFVVQPGKISYIGRVDAIMREKEDNDFPAGPATPLLQQGVSGIAKSTFDISVVDAFDLDKSYFSSVYPELKTQNIEKYIIPQWERPSKTQYNAPNTHFGFFNK
ncbi:hypothetical protein ACFL5W_02095 [Thermodesulfobacteriota bacterium]